jgi:hypothetical protein
MGCLLSINKLKMRSKKIAEEQLKQAKTQRYPVKKIGK